MARSTSAASQCTIIRARQCRLECVGTRARHGGRVRGKQIRLERAHGIAQTFIVGVRRNQQPHVAPRTRVSRASAGAAAQLHHVAAQPGAHSTLTYFPALFQLCNAGINSCWLPTPMQRGNCMRLTRSPTKTLQLCELGLQQAAACGCTCTRAHTSRCRCLLRMNHQSPCHI